MQPTPTDPQHTPADNAAAPNASPKAPTHDDDAPLASTEPTSGPAGSTYEEYKQKTADGIQSVLDSSKQTLDKGKQWLEDADLAGKAKELPKKAKELGNKAIGEISGLSTMQKALGVGLIAAGVALLIVRGKRRKAKDDGEYRKRPQKSPFSKHGASNKGEDSYGRGGRPWGSSRYGASAPASGDKSRITSGSGYSSGAQGNGPRRDQGPTSGSNYDVNTSGNQNPNNSDQLNSAF